MTGIDNFFNKMAEQWKLLHQQALLVMGFMGGISFTGLVLLLQSPEQFEPSGWAISGEVYLTFLLVLIGSICIVSIIGSVMMVSVASGQLHPFGKQGGFAWKCLVVALAMLLISIPLLILPTSPIGGFGIFAIIIIMAFLAGHYQE